VPEHSQRTISVFGGSAPTADSAAYEMAMRLGALIAAAGWRVASGGYEGSMEAVSRGARQAGGQALGVTCDVFERAGLKPNAWVSEVVHLSTLRERLYYLVNECDAAVALPGGIGTLSEVAFTWSLMQAGEIAAKPLILVGPEWNRTVLAFLDSQAGMVRPRDLELVTLCPTVEAAIEELTRRLGPAGVAHAP
jgi:uncharacterized protein (TIGR00730 family)